ncbi:MAG: phosphonate ABC transporter ATP-binding protein [Fimbriimonas sp.]
MALIEIDRLEKSFGNGVMALGGVSLQFQSGEIVAVLGPSGAGKSTLLRCINGLESPTSGSIRVDGVDVVPANYRRVRKDVGMVFQQFHLVPRLTVMANVLVGRLAVRNWITSFLFAFPKEDLELASTALEQVGLLDRAWERADRLSGGQQQRVAIARSLVQQPKVILADEPVASLDPAVSEVVLGLLVDAARKQDAALVLNLHQVDYARQFAQRIVGLRKGQMLFDIPADQLTDEHTRELYGGSPA